MSTNWILEVSDLSKLFYLHDQQKLIPSAQNVKLRVYPGQLTALVGPTGAGKSSVLKAIYRTYIPSGGEIHYRREDDSITDLASAELHAILALRRDEISFVTQFLHHLPRQAAVDVIAQPLVVKGMDRDEARQIAIELLVELRIPEDLWKLSPSTFSGGERQRINLARGIASKPRLLLLDEPTASLDPKTADTIVAMLQRLKERGTGLLAIFHSPALVEQLADLRIELESPKSLIEEQVA